MYFVPLLVTLVTFFTNRKVCGLSIPSVTEILNRNYDRNLNYESFNIIDSKWEKIEQNNYDNERNNKFDDFDAIYFMKLQRFINESNEIGEFNIYKFVINSSVADLINGQNSRPQIIHDTEKEASNVKVSNVGGTHGYPTLFKASPPTHKTSEIAHLASIFAEEYENFQFHFPIREFEPIRSSEAWLNINCHNHYNNVHHHGGAAWSGVIYCHMPYNHNDDDDDDNVVNNNLIEGGDLIIKPEPHPSQDNDYVLKDYELNRLSRRQACNGERHQRLSCSYFKYQPREGQIILFPSWMYHGVSALNVKNKEDRHLRRGKRVSVAFNIVSL